MIKDTSKCQECLAPLAGQIGPYCVECANKIIKRIFGRSLCNTDLHDWEQVANVPYEYQRMRCKDCGATRVMTPDNRVR